MLPHPVFLPACLIVNFRSTVSLPHVQQMWTVNERSHRPSCGWTWPPLSRIAHGTTEQDGGGRSGRAPQGRQWRPGRPEGRGAGDAQPRPQRWPQGHVSGVCFRTSPRPAIQPRVAGLDQNYRDAFLLRSVSWFYPQQIHHDQAVSGPISLYL